MAELNSFKTLLEANHKEGFDKEQITEDEYKAMKPGEKCPGKMYHLFKGRMLKAPPVILRTYISRSSKIDPTDRC